MATYKEKKLKLKNYYIVDNAACVKTNLPTTLRMTLCHLNHNKIMCCNYMKVLNYHNDLM